MYFKFLYFFVLHNQGCVDGENNINQYYTNSLCDPIK